MTQDNDPWGNNPKNTEGSDLSDLLSKLKEGFFGGGKKPKNTNHSDDNPENSNPFTFPTKIVLPLIFVFISAWLLTGIYVLKEGDNGVELTFGKYHETATTPGFNFVWPKPFGSVKKVDVNSIRALTVGSNNTSSEGQMLTSDENIVEVSLNVQYKIADAKKYLFNVNDPEKVLKQAFISSIREVVGGSNVDYVLTEGVAEWPTKVRENLISTLDGFDAGLDIIRVKLSKSSAPKELQDAFDDAAKARENEQQYILDAKAYQSKQIPLARGNAKKITEDAEAYKAGVIAKATGEANRFEGLLESYQLAPDVTRARMYLEAMQNVYKNVNNVVVATGDNAPIMYMPLGQTAEQTAGSQVPPLPVKATANKTDDSNQPMSPNDIGATNRESKEIKLMLSAPKTESENKTGRLTR